MTNATSSKCETASLNAAYFIEKKRRNDLFSKQFLIRAYSRQGEQQYPFTGPLGNEKWSMHAFLCIQLFDQSWVAISPANYNATTEHQVANAVIQSEDFNSLIDKIEGACGGRWPRISDLDAIYIKPETKVSYRKTDKDRKYTRIIKILTVSRNIEGETLTRAVEYDAYFSERMEDGKYRHLEQRLDW